MRYLPPYRFTAACAKAVYFRDVSGSWIVWVATTYATIFGSAKVGTLLYKVFKNV